MGTTTFSSSWRLPKWMGRRQEADVERAQRWRGVKKGNEATSGRFSRPALSQPKTYHSWPETNPHGFAQCFPIPSPSYHHSQAPWLDSLQGHGLQLGIFRGICSRIRADTNLNTIKFNNFLWDRNEIYTPWLISRIETRRHNLYKQSRLQLNIKLSKPCGAHIHLWLLKKKIVELIFIQKFKLKQSMVRSMAHSH